MTLPVMKLKNKHILYNPQASEVLTYSGEGYFSWISPKITKGNCSLIYIMNYRRKCYCPVAISFCHKNCVQIALHCFFKTSDQHMRKTSHVFMVSIWWIDENVDSGVAFHCSSKNSWVRTFFKATAQPVLEVWSILTTMLCSAGAHISLDILNNVLWATNGFLSLFQCEGKC